MMRLTYLFYRLSSSLRHRMGRRLTAAGWLTMTGMVVTGLVGVDLDQSVAAQSFAVLLCLFAVAMCRAFFFRGRFTVERRLPRFGSVGQRFIYRICVKNQMARQWRELELFDELADPRPNRQQFTELHRASLGKRSFRLSRTSPGALDPRRAVIKPAGVPPLLPRGEAEAQLEALPLKRGPLRFVGATLAQSDPFGLCRGFL